MEYDRIFVAFADPTGKGLVAFYRKLLGQEPTVQLSDHYAEFQLENLRLGIFKPKLSDQAEFAVRSSGSMSLCLVVRSLESAIATLTELGCPPPGEISIATHGREIYAYDPLGNRLILYEAQENRRA